MDQHIGMRKFAAVLDLGRGTGLMGFEAQDIAQNLIGVDLSPKNAKSSGTKSGLYRIDRGRYNRISDGNGQEI